MIYFVADAWSIARTQSNNTRAQQSLVITHYRVRVSTQSTLRGAKNTFTVPQLYHHSLIVIQGSGSWREM